jgi:hypothetical protein
MDSNACRAREIDRNYRRERFFGWRRLNREIALSRRQHRFESGRGRQENQRLSFRSMRPSRIVRNIYGIDVPGHR